MTLREEVLKNSGVAAKAVFEKKKEGFERELKNLENQYGVGIDFGYISPEDDDEIIIYDKRKGSIYKTYLNTETDASQKLDRSQKNREAKERVGKFINALHSLEKKYGLEFGLGYIDAGDDDDFMVYDANNTAYIDV